jgi:phosphatidate phosphatase APP1
MVDLNDIIDDNQKRESIGLRRKIRNKSDVDVFNLDESNQNLPSVFTNLNNKTPKSENTITDDSGNVIVKKVFKIGPQNIDTNVEVQPKSDVEKVIEEVIENPYLDLVDADNQIYVDYRDLCYYISWCLSSPTFDSIENNGVLTANELSKFEFTNKTNDTDKQENPTENTGDAVRLEPTGRFFEYDIVRLTIPATLDQSKMKFRNQAGEMQEIQTDQYGLIGRFCCEENSWAENHYVYQKTQIGPCGERNSFNSGGAGGYSGYGYSKDYDTRVGSVDYINQQRDFENIQ